MAEQAENKDLKAELFGESDSDEEFAEEPQVEQSLQAEPGVAAPNEAEEEPLEQADYAAPPDQLGNEAPDAAQQDYNPEDDLGDQWIGHTVHEEAEEVNEDDELEAMFKPKKKRKTERPIEEKKAAVESILARMEVAAELDMEANQNRQPAIQKLQLLPEVEQSLVQRDLHDEFLDGGVLGVMKAWLEPMPDGSLPNAKVRTAVLRLLLQLNFYFEDRKEQLKKSQLGHVIMFLSKLPDELPANRKMARDLVHKWSRPIFEQYRSERRDELEAEREADELRAQLLKQKVARRESEEGAQSRALKPTDKGFRFSAAVPEKAKLNYKRMPASLVAVDPAEAGRKVSGGRSERIQKKIADLGKRGKRSGKATSVSVEGRGLVQLS